MQRKIWILVIQYILSTSEVESLRGSKVTNADYRELPFIASLQYFPEGQHFCTGSLITRRHVLTSAHCLEDEKPEGMRIVFGMTSLPSTNTKYTVASWQTFDDWAERLNIPKEQVFHDIAIVTLSNNVCQRGVRPIRLTELNKLQVQGRDATIIGWKEHGTTSLLRKATVKILNDEDCTRNIRLITNDLQETSARTLCSAAQPYVLVDCGDSGGPIIDQHDRLLGVHFGPCPDEQHAWGDFSDEFLRQYQVNLHFSVDYYRQFLVNVTDYH